LTVSIIDDGVGFDVDAGFGRGLGLVSMHERVEAIGGTLRVQSAPGEGTRLRIRVPVDVRQSVKLAG
jgi:signal transduction histidine kinase